MDLISTNYTSDTDAFSPCASNDDKVDAFNNLEELPRTGDMFQAKIPPLGAYYDERTCSLQPIPITWAHLDFDHSDKKVLENGASPKCINNEPRHITPKGRYPLPGSLGKPWSEVERESFVLGLYIFGKNMKLVKKFVECKEMEDVLSFYYGEFYSSDRYHKWAQFLKRRNTRSLHGHKIFSSGKLLELCSRLAHHMPEKCQAELLEASRTFEEGELPLEEFVDILKNAAGIENLIEAVGIGRGKQDLTVANAVVKKTAAQPTNPTKPKRAISTIRRKMAFLKACTALSTADIVKVLTGDSRLGKARSNDLFWEAVWPRLLARGWHSEHRNRHGDSGLNDNLVFLIPGIDKFNRRKLTKGQHYFDTLDEVLSKIASNPSLLNGPSETTEDRREETVEQQHSDSSNDSDEKEITFTIVDTSLFSGGRRTKTRKLKSTVNDTEKAFDSMSCSSEDEVNTPKKSDEDDDDDSSVREACANLSVCVTSTVHNSSHNALDSNQETPSPSPTSCFSKEDQAALSSKPEVSPAAKCGDSSGSNGSSTPEQPRHKTKTMSVNSENKKDATVLSRVAPSDHVVPESSRNESPQEQQQQPKPLRLLVKGPSRPKPQQPAVPERRQSTRSRPLTTKALEAIESGLSLSPPHKKRKVIERMAKNDTRIPSLSPV